MPPRNCSSSTCTNDSFGTTDCHLDRHQHRPFSRNYSTIWFPAFHNVAAYLDDVIVIRRTKVEHLQNLKQVLSALNEYSMKLDKCEFFRHQVTCLGHVISADGLKPSKERVDAIVKIPTPENVKQLESFTEGDARPEDALSSLRSN